MALITVAGEPGSRYEEISRLAAQRLRFDLIAATTLSVMLEREFGPILPAQAWPDAATSLLLRLATQSHLVAAFPHVEMLLKPMPGVLRIAMLASDTRRIGTLMLEKRLDRPEAMQELKAQDAALREERRMRFGRMAVPPGSFDLALNADTVEADEAAALIDHAARLRGLPDHGPLSHAADAQLQFQLRLRLARHGITPPGRVTLKRAAFVHPSEEIFANLLDFYRIAWEYEPRSFAIQWDRDGRVLEAFTPDFYLPEFDLYVELTTMKQSLVTRKNRKIKLLREIYPQVNIQVFYQKDFQNLIFKYGLADREPQP